MSHMETAPLDVVDQITEDHVPDGTRGLIGFILHYRLWLLILELLSFALYLMELIVLSNSKRITWRTDFYSQCWILGVFNLLCYISNLSERIFQITEVADSYAYVADAFVRATTNGHSIAMILMNVSRFRVLMNPAIVVSHVGSHSSFLVNRSLGSHSTRYRLRTLFFLIVVALISVTHRFLCIVFLGWPDENFLFGVNAVDWYNRIYATCVLIVPCVFCVLLNVIMIFKWKSGTTYFQNKNVREKNKQMMFYALFIIVTTIPLAVTRALGFSGTIRRDKKLVTLMASYYQYCYFPFTFGNAYLMLAMSELRKELWNMLKCTKPSATDSVQQSVPKTEATRDVFIWQLSRNGSRERVTNPRESNPRESNPRESIPRDEISVSVRMFYCRWRDRC